MPVPRTSRSAWRATASPPPSAWRTTAIGIREPTLDAKGMGLKIMHYRAGLINGRLSVGPAESGGTIVTCTCNKDPQHARTKTQVE